MKNRNSLVWLLLAIVGAVCFSSCKKNPLKYIPFHGEDEDWGMMTLDGEVLFKDKFENAPTISYNGIFLVKNKDGMWEYYTAEENPKQIGDEYVEATFFSKGGVAVVARKDKCVEVIDRDGEVKFKLDKFDGKTVKSVTMFNDDGLAVVTVDGDKKGVVDEDGEMVLPAKYCRLRLSNYAGIQNNNDYILAVDAKYEDDMYEENTNGKWLIINKSGDMKTELPMKKYKNVYVANDNLFVVELQDEKGYGIIDKDGEEVVAPKKKYKNIIRVNDKRFAYVDDDKNVYVCDFDGNMLFKDKYDGLAVISDKRFVVGKDEKFSILDENGKKLSNGKYDDFLLFAEGYDRLIMKKGKHYYSVDLDGDETELEDVEEIGLRDPDYNVSSQKGLTDLGSDSTKVDSVYY